MMRTAKWKRKRTMSDDLSTDFRMAFRGPTALLDTHNSSFSND